MDRIKVTREVLVSHNAAEERKARVRIARITLSSIPYRPWTAIEARRLEIEARHHYFTHDHEDPDQIAVACLSCKLRGRFGNPPMVNGWERMALQASQPIRLRYIGRVMQDPILYADDYRIDMVRDVQTFGLVITCW